MSGAILNVSSYRFVTLEDLPALRERLHDAAEAAGLKGTVLLAPEGINLFLAGAADALRAWLDALRGDARFAGLDAKESWSAALPFKRLKVKIKREIIRMDWPLPAGQARAARQGQQDGLDLIVRMLGNRNVFDSNIGPFHAGNCLKSFVSCLAGGIFGACAAPVPRVHPAHGQWHTQACAQRLAVQLEAISGRLKAMVNVHGAHLPGPFFGAGQQQRGGIGTAAERNRQGQAGMECSQCLRQGLAHGGSSGAGGSRARGGLTCCRPWCR